MFIFWLCQGALVVVQHLKNGTWFSVCALYGKLTVFGALGRDDGQHIHELFKS